MHILENLEVSHENSKIFSVYIPDENEIHNYNSSYNESYNDDKNRNNTSEQKAEKTYSKYNSRKRAEKEVSLFEIPDRMALPIISPYQNALTALDNSVAYLQPVATEIAEKLKFDNGILYFEGIEANRINLEKYFDNTPDTMSKIDLPTLRMLYSIILQNIISQCTSIYNIMEILENYRLCEQKITIYVRDFLRLMGYAPTISSDSINVVIKKIAGYQNILGVVREQRGNYICELFYPVIIFHENNLSNGTVSFSSPYMSNIVIEMLKNSVKKTKTGEIKTYPDGKPVFLPSNSFLVKSSIATEKNKRAVEIVCIIISMIEQCDNNIPHISVRTLIDYCPDLKCAFDSAKSASDANKILKRAFSKAWELLRTQTFLTETYINIQIPDIIPTSCKLDTVLEFHHEGKIKKV